MLETLSQPWPWYVAGSLIGLIVPLLLLLGGKQFGVSSNLRHICAATLPANIEFLRYDWKKSSLWNLTFVLDIVIGGVLVGFGARYAGGCTSGTPSWDWLTCSFRRSWRWSASSSAA